MSSAADWLSAFFVVSEVVLQDGYWVVVPETCDDCRLSRRELGNLYKVDCAVADFFQLREVTLAPGTFLGVLVREDNTFCSPLSTSSKIRRLEPQTLYPKT